MYANVLYPRVRREKHMEVCKNRDVPVFQCPHSCPAIFTNANDLKYHVGVFHKYKRAYTCEYCKKECATRNTLWRHLARTCRPKLGKTDLQTKVRKIRNSSNLGNVLEDFLSWHMTKEIMATMVIILMSHAQSVKFRLKSSLVTQ